MSGNDVIKFKTMSIVKKLFGIFNSTASQNFIYTDISQIMTYFKILRTKHLQAFKIQN